jgi:hypothetical protein
MDIDPLYRQAIFPETFEVLGRRLAVFTFAHLAALIEADSPYLRGERGDAADLLAAVGICSADGSVPWPFGLVKRPLTPALAAAGIDGWSRSEKKKWAKALRNTAILAQEENAFLAYISESFATPKYGKASGSSVPSAPWLASLIASVLRRGATARDVWGLPFAQWLWITAAADELETGKTTMMSESEREQVGEINRLAATAEGAAAAKEAVRRGKIDTWGK